MTFEWFLISVGVVLIALVVRFWAPAAMRQKIRQAGLTAGSDEPARPTVAPDLLPAPPSQALRQKEVHDEMVTGAARLLTLARTHDARSMGNLDEADEKIEEALMLRPDSFEALRLRAEIAIARAGLVPVGDKAGIYEVAAGHFDAVIDMRKGIPDLYNGLAWSWLGVARYDPARSEAITNALGAFQAGHQVSPGNLWTIKGWGSAVDIMRRQDHPDAPVAVAQYESMMATLRGPAASAAAEFFAEVASAPEATWLPVPALRDITSTPPPDIYHPGP